MEGLVPELSALVDGVLVEFPESLQNSFSNLQVDTNKKHASNCRLCFLLISCIKRYISVLWGSGCSQSFLGTSVESIE